MIMKKTKTKSESEAQNYYESLDVPRRRVLDQNGRFLRNYGPAELYVIPAKPHPRVILLVPIGFPNQGRSNTIGWDIYESVASETNDAEATFAAAGLGRDAR
jgi:hypothetical protein